MIHPVPRYAAAIGELRPAILSCPPCSYLVDGSCMVCPDGDGHPGCAGCVGGRMAPPAWYKSDLFISVAGSLIVTIIGAMALTEMKRMKIL